jgi:hypothetical protein
MDSNMQYYVDGLAYHLAKETGTPCEHAEAKIHATLTKTIEKLMAWQPSPEELDRPARGRV